MQNCKCTESARSTDWMCQFSHFFHPRTKFLRTRPAGFALNHSYSISLHLFFQERRQEDQSINIAMWRMIDSALHLVLPPSEVRNPLRQPVYQRTDSPLFIFRQSDGEDQNPIHTIFTCFCRTNRFGPFLRRVWARSCVRLSSATQYGFHGPQAMVESCLRVIFLELPLHLFLARRRIVYIFPIWLSELLSGDIVKIRTAMQRLIRVKQRVVALGIP